MGTDSGPGEGSAMDDAAVLELLAQQGFEPVDPQRRVTWVLRLPDGGHHAVSRLGQGWYSLYLCFPRHDVTRRVARLWGLEHGDLEQMLAPAGFHRSGGAAWVRETARCVEAVYGYLTKAVVFLEAQADQLPALLDAALGPLPAVTSASPPPARPAPVRTSSRAREPQAQQVRLEL